MKGEEHIDFEGLAAFINGELSPEEESRWMEWIENSPENARVYRDMLKLLEPDPETSETPSLTFNSKKAWKSVESRIGDAPAGYFTWWRVAAVFVVFSILAGFLVYQQFFADIVYSQTSGISEYMLPDSSRIVLNGPASVRLDRRFNKDHRKVSLVGRAYFDVRRDTSLTFDINTLRGRVQVLGTAFLVEETSDSLYVLVDRGKVSVGLKKGNQQLILERNDEVVIRFSDERILLDELENTNKLYWANKRLSYRQENLSTVLDELSQIFEVSVDYDPEAVKDCRITAVFLNQGLDEILENISLSLPVQYTISGNRVEITTNGCSAQ